MNRDIYSHMSFANAARVTNWPSFCTMMYVPICL